MAQNVPKCLLGSRERNLKGDFNKFGLEMGKLRDVRGWLNKEGKPKNADAYGGVEEQTGSLALI